MAWPFTFAALTAPKLSNLDSNFADAAQLGTAVNFTTAKVTDGTDTGVATLLVAEKSGTGTAAFAVEVGGVSQFDVTGNGTVELVGPVSMPFSSAANKLTITQSGATAATGIAINLSNTSSFDILFEYAGTVIGSVSPNAAGTATNYNTTSDAALKTIHGVADGTPLAALPVRDASFTSTPDVRHPMLIAQEVAAVCPWAVTEGDGTPENPSMIDHGALVPALLAYAQSLEARIAALEGVTMMVAKSLMVDGKPALSFGTPAPTAAAVSCRAALAAVAKLPVMLAAFARGDTAPSQGGSVAAP